MLIDVILCLTVLLESLFMQSRLPQFIAGAGYQSNLYCNYTNNTSASELTFQLDFPIVNNPSLDFDLQ